MHKNANSNAWMVGILFIIILAALAWWLSGGNGLKLPANEMATSTAATTTRPVVHTTRSSQDVVAIAESLSGASRFAALLVSTGVAGEIKATGKYTIFVPTDGAFSFLAPGALDNMKAADKKRLVEYHIVANRVIDIDGVLSGSIEALSRDMLNFSVGVTDKVPRVNSALIVAQYTGKNGIVYLINNVLIPPKKIQ